MAENGIPLVKPIMSSLPVFASKWVENDYFGGGDYVLRSKYFEIKDDLQKAWDYPQQGGRAGAGRVIVKDLLNSTEITLLTVCHTCNGTSFLAPIGHRQRRW